MRSCYCKLRSSFPATISEEKLDFVCNCRRAEQPILLFKAQHKHADADSYLPTGSIRTATTYRSRYYRTGNRREPGRAKHGWFEGSRQHETFERQRRKRKRGRNRPSTSDDEIEPPTRETSESIKELVLNESDPNEAGNERMCSCDSQGCVGNCEQLSGCVCSDSDRCWGSSCKSPLSSVNSLSSQFASSQFGSPQFSSSQFSTQRPNELHRSRPPQSELIDLVYLSSKGQRNRKFKNVNEVYGPSESILSRINMEQPPFYAPHPIVPHHHRPLAMEPIHQAIFGQPPSQLTFKSLIGDMESASQQNNGRCNCRPNGRCSGSECNNLKGCICDELSCYGKYCKLFKSYFAEQLSSQIGNRPEHRPALSKSIRYRLNSQLSDISEDKQPATLDDLPPMNGKETFAKEFGRDYGGRQYAGREYGGKEDDRDYGKEYGGREHAKESSKTLKCERINDEASEEAIRPQQNRTQPTSSNNANSLDDKLSAYEMKVVKLTPVSSSQYIEAKNIPILGSDLLQNRVDDNVTQVESTKLIH